MRPRFPGMDPWLERSDLWPDVHSGLINSIRNELAPRLRPRYFVGVELRTTLLSGPDVDRVYEPDVVVLSKVNFVELDLLRGGRPMPLLNPPPRDDYRILICRARPRRKAVLYSFPWTTPIPAIPIPLLPGDAEPVLDLNSVLHSLMDRAG